MHLLCSITVSYTWFLIQILQVKYISRNFRKSHAAYMLSGKSQGPLKGLHFLTGDLKQTELKSKNRKGAELCPI